MSRKRFTPRVDRNDPSKAMIFKLADEVHAEVQRRGGASLSYEARRDLAATIMSETLWAEESKDVQEQTTNEDEVEEDGRRYRRMNQPSRRVYFGRWGPHEVLEPLYRAVGVHNGPTLKPFERRVGVIAGSMLPDLARITGELSADGNSREVEHLMRVVGFSPPSRSFLEKRVHEMASELSKNIQTLEKTARALEPSLAVFSVSCGMDRMAVRMSEAHPDPENAAEPRRGSV